ncbi:hypothetical protein [Granulicella tundricola]|uniref:Uncharacterized protein n=1 Tax=Granulicella tundricola (strain ATCC BAA-1859 / DSM 23138 / MP5ACTX9) TaxID=1198114 RepID=E8X0N6_GRATM|nr:hypothetical protein [Granulicella tundricola]ADW68987.1 hypothetical protein AciX9_1941 [Granulicella tundricola MP5ACTX9]
MASVTVTGLRSILISLANSWDLRHPSESKHQQALCDCAKLFTDPAFEQQPGDTEQQSETRESERLQVFRVLEEYGGSFGGPYQEARSEAPTTYIHAYTAFVRACLLRPWKSAISEREEVFTEVRGHLWANALGRGRWDELPKDHLLRKLLERFQVDLPLLRVCANPACRRTRRLFIATKEARVYCGTDCAAEGESLRLKKVVRKGRTQAAGETNKGPKSVEGRARIAAAQRKRHAEKRAKTKKRPNIYLNG